MRQRRHEENQNKRQNDDETEKNDERRRQPVKSQALQMHGQRIEQIGDDEGRGEGQDHAVEQPQQHDKARQGRKPEDDLPLDPHENDLTTPWV